MPASITHRTTTAQAAPDKIGAAEWDEAHDLSGVWTEDNFDPATKADAAAVTALETELAVQVQSLRNRALLLS